MAFLENLGKMGVLGGSKWIEFMSPPPVDEMEVKIHFSHCRSSANLEKFLGKCVHEISEKTHHRVTCLSLLSEVNDVAVPRRNQKGDGFLTKFFQYDPIKKSIICSFSIDGKRVSKSTTIGEFLKIRRGKVLKFHVSFGCLERIKLLEEEVKEVKKIPQLEKEVKEYRDLLQKKLLNEEEDSNKTVQSQQKNKRKNKKKKKRRRRKPPSFSKNKKTIESILLTEEQDQENGENVDLVGTEGEQDTTTSSVDNTTTTTTTTNTTSAEINDISSVTDCSVEENTQVSMEKENKDLKKRMEEKSKKIEELQKVIRKYKKFVQDQSYFMCQAFDVGIVREGIREYENMKKLDDYYREKDGIEDDDDDEEEEGEEGEPENEEKI